MRLTLDALETLDAIAEKGSFARAAESLHRVPSAVTYTVNKLESDMGIALFDRSGQRAVLTPAGRELLERGRDLLRQAEALECRMKRAALGWETQLVIAVDEIVPLEHIFPLIQRFDALECGTRLRFTQEIFGGSWDALMDRRADLAIAAPGEPPAGYGLQSREWATAHFLFVCAPQHPLAQLKAPLTGEQIAQHRGIVVSDSSRRLPARTAGVLPGQPVLVVPTLAAKRDAHIAGLGVGFLPVHYAADAVKAGTLVTRQTALPREPTPVRVGWREGDEGEALKWFRDAVLAEPSLQKLFALPETERPPTLRRRPSKKN